MNDVQGPGSRETGLREESGSSLHRVPTLRLFWNIIANVKAIAGKEVHLAKAEFHAMLESGRAMLVWLAVAVACTFLGLNLLLVAAVFALARAGWLSGWAAALVLAGLAFVIAIGAGLIAWSHRISTLFARTREALSEDLT